jgi:hypothetical protein
MDHKRPHSNELVSLPLQSCSGWSVNKKRVDKCAVRDKTTTLKLLRYDLVCY